MKARMVTEVRAKLPDAPGLVAQVTTALVAGGVDILAIVAWASNNTATFQLAAAESTAAEAALLDMGAEVTTRTAVAVDMPHKPGALDAAARRIAEASVNINHIYGSAFTGASKATIIFETEDDEMVLHLLSGPSASADVIL